MLSNFYIWNKGFDRCNIENKRRRENTPVCGVTGFISNMINMIRHIPA